MPKILIVGHARHGKDTAAEYLRDQYAFKCKGSSEICAGFIRKAMQQLGVKYASDHDCYIDRGNHRGFWYQAIKTYCSTNLSAVADLIYATNDIYCGIRNKEELEAVKAKYNPVIIWVDAGLRVDLESKESMNIEYTDDMIFVNNDSTIDVLHNQLDLAVTEF